MDTKKDAKIAQCGNGVTSRILVGAKQIRKALERGNAKSVILAANADPAVTGPIEALCQQHHVSCTWFPSMEALGKACGIDVCASAAAVVE